MAEEPDNLILVQLREIRSKLEKLEKLDVLERRFDAMDRRFDAMDKRFDEMRTYVYYSLGLGSVNQLKAAELEARIEALEARPQT